jgi:hypothetical protein
MLSTSLSPSGSRCGYKDTWVEAAAVQTPYSCLVSNKKPVVPDVPPITRPERSIGYALIACLVLSVASFVALIIAGPLVKGAVWASVAILPLIGMPIAIILLVVLLVLGTRRRMRANPKGAGK